MLGSAQLAEGAREEDQTVALMNKLISLQKVILMGMLRCLSHSVVVIVVVAVVVVAAADDDDDDDDDDADTHTDALVFRSFAR